MSPVVHTHVRESSSCYSFNFLQKSFVKENDVRATSHIVFSKVMGVSVSCVLMGDRFVPAMCGPLVRVLVPGCFSARLSWVGTLDDRSPGIVVRLVSAARPEKGSCRDPDPPLPRKERSPPPHCIARATTVSGGRLGSASSGETRAGKGDLVGMCYRRRGGVLSPEHCWWAGDAWRAGGASVPDQDALPVRAAARGAVRCQTLSGVPTQQPGMKHPDSSSVGSDEDAYDECSKPPPRYNYNALRAQHYDQYRPANTSNTTSPLGYPVSMYGHSGTPSVYNASTYKYDSGFVTNKEEIYSGSKSMYAKSPPLPRSSSLNRSQSVYTKPPPPRMDNYSRNLAQSQNLCPKSPATFTAPSHSESMYKNNPRQDSLYITSKSGIVKPEPVYGTAAYNKQHDSGDSNYSTYRGSTGYSSSRSSNPGPPIPMSRTRQDNLTPNSNVSAHSGLVTPNSVASCYSPNPQY
ncbi:uncharacterized protein LOC119599103 [Penaeus monodon]|uniref:uncharacterized protein LOC119599103 n=1 Tax=Penaeus monodon TaxID=6687 RepID=UPI0018A75692|nr:uncharacterized protein LOC119599103 [Penaeus monodon]